MFLGLHAQRGDAGRLAVGVHVEVVAIDGSAHAWAAKQAAHVRLSHVSSGAGHSQEVGHPASWMRVGGHAGRDGVAGHHAAWDRRCGAAATNP